ncbi:MAG: hypothetical protein ABSE49_29230 [Polyangiaceae bacterium]|jgi:hypothetical protein
MRLGFLAAVVGPLVGVACSSSSGGSGQGPAANGGDFATDFCNLIEPCCAQAGLSTSGTLCLAFAGEAAASGSYDATAGQACIAGMQAESGTPALCMNLGNDIPACSQVYATKGGSTPPGGTCMQDSDCAIASGGGATCFDDFTFDDGGSTQTETCIQTMVGSAGDGPCIGTVEGAVTTYSWGGTGAPPTTAYTCDNASDLTCDATTQKCLALGDTGATCTSDSDCVTTDYCNFDTATAACAPRFADGAACGEDSTGCVTTDYCDTTSATCKPLLAAGTACSTSQQCASTECVNGSCGAANNLGLQLLCGTN